MSALVIPSRYFADDEDIFDVLKASFQKATQKRLVEILRERGHLVAGDEDRDDLIARIARLSFSWPQLKALLEGLGRSDRPEKTSHVDLVTGANTKSFLEAVEKAKTVRAQKRGEVYRILRPAVGAVSAVISYSEVDHARTRLFQKIPRTLNIDAQRHKGFWRLTHEAQPRAEDIIAEIADALAQLSGTGKAKKRRTIELGGVTAPKLRTKFFWKLMQGIDGWKYRSVRSVRLERNAAKPTDALPPSTGSSSDTTAPTDAEEPVVLKARFQGEGLLQTQDYIRFKKQGYFITHSVWTADDVTGVGNRVEFEAGFADGKSATKFRYAVRGVYRRNSKTNEIRKMKVAATDEEMQGFIRKLEAAAHRAHAMVTGDAT